MKLNIMPNCNFYRLVRSDNNINGYFKIKRIAYNKK